MLDSKVKLAEFDWMYSDRPQAPFIVQNELPDENLIEFIESIDYPKPQDALELGCGEGRNAIYMARKSINVTAIDISQVAINNAKRLANKHGVNVNFVADDIFKAKLGSYQFVYDCGCLHHLAPHRRLTYLDLLDKVLISGGYLGLSCFAWGKNCADEVDDWEFYNSGFHAGVAFTEGRLRGLFNKRYDTIYVREYKNGIRDTIQGLEFMLVCLFKKK
ncbi:MAG: class I SAM-dependent methyltransferase [Oscillospiraceae bacterium]|nr:class I SAM-dependent methyltransferase [Oscillospiraceae bacterium]